MSGRLVLVVDNEAQTVNLISGALEPLGYTVVSAASGDEGLAKSKENAPSLILLNLAVPNTDGLRICKAFMSITDTPIILLTMREGKYDPRYKAQYGIVDFIKKPVNAQELAEKTGEYAPLIETAAEVVEEEPESVDAFEIPEEEVVEEEPESADAFEIPEEEVPSSHELEASIASYTEGEEPLTPVEEEAEVAEAVEVVPEEDVIEAEEAIEVVSEDEITEAVEEIEETVAEAEAPAKEEEVPEWPALEESVEEESPAEEEPAPEWSIPEEETKEEVPEWPAAEEEAPAEEAAGWSLPEEEAPPEPAAPTAEDMDWSSLGEEITAPEEDFEKAEMAPSGKLEAKDLFEDEAGPSKDEPIPYEEDIKYPGEEAEYEIRPAALERHKRRKSKTRIFIPVLAILLVCAIAAGLYFFFISGKEKAPQLLAPKPSAPVAKKAEPAPPPPEKAPPSVEKAPPSVERKPVAPAATGGKVYYVQFGAFRSKDNANNFRIEIKELGYDTLILESRLKGQPLYLVLLADKFTDKWNAFKQAKQIKNDSNIGTSVYSE